MSSLKLLVLPLLAHGVIKISEIYAATRQKAVSSFLIIRSAEYNGATLFKCKPL